MIIMNEDLAEVVGAFIGDGCLSRYYIKNREKWQEVILFTGSWQKDSPYYKKIIQNIITKEFKLKCELYHRLDDDTVRFRTYDKGFISFLLKMGFKFGPKAHNVKIPDIILSKDSLLKGCIRGIFNTDGTIYQRYSKKYSGHPKHYANYKVVQFKSKSLKLMRQIRTILLKLEFMPNKIIKDGKNSNCYVCRLTSQKDIEVFDNEINTTHQYHMDRYNSICK